MPFNTYDGNPPMSLATGGDNVIPQQFIQQMAQQQAMAQQQQMAQQAAQMPVFNTMSGGQDDLNAQIEKAKFQARMKGEAMLALKATGAFNSPYDVYAQKHPILSRLGEGMLAAGQSLTGQPTYTNFKNNQAEMQRQNQQAMNRMIGNERPNLPIIRIGSDGIPRVVGEAPQGSFVSKDEGTTLGLKEDQWRAKTLKDMGDDLDPAKSVRNALGVGKLGLARGQRIEGLVNQYKDLNLDQREIKELAIGMNSLLQGSNMSAQQQVSSLVPKSIWGDANKLAEWLTNNPKGTQQQAFVQRMVNDVRREVQVSNNQIYDMLLKKVPKYNTLREKFPNDWEEIIRSQGINPEAYDAWRKGGFKKNDVVGVFDLSDADSVPMSDSGSGNLTVDNLFEGL